MMISLFWCVLFFLVLPTDDAVMSCPDGSFQTENKITAKVIITICFIIIPVVIFLITNLIILNKVRLMDKCNLKKKKLYFKMKSSRRAVSDALTEEQLNNRLNEEKRFNKIIFTQFGIFFFLFFLICFRMFSVFF